MKIFIYAIPQGKDPTTKEELYLGYALCEDGAPLASHLSASIKWVKHDMGLTSLLKHDIYREHCQNNYELEWVEFENLEKHEGFMRAWELNRGKNPLIVKEEM